MRDDHAAIEWSVGVASLSLLVFVATLRLAKKWLSRRLNSRFNGCVYIESFIVVLAYHLLDKNHALVWCCPFLDK